MHDVYIVGVPLVAIIAGILFNRADVQGLRTEMRSDMQALRTEVRADIQSLRTETTAQHAEIMVRLGNIDGDLRQFYHLTGKLEARVENLEKR